MVLLVSGGSGLKMRLCWVLGLLASVFAYTVLLSLLNRRYTLVQQSDINTSLMMVTTHTISTLSTPSNASSTTKNMSHSGSEVTSYRILCYLPLRDQEVSRSSLAVYNTWGKRCNKLVFFSTTSITTNWTRTVGLGIKDYGSNNMSEKMLSALQYLHTHYVADYDWFMKADTDTYVIVENLRHFLAKHSKAQPLYFGQHFVSGGVHYASGGAGYVLSQQAIRIYGQNWTQHNICQPTYVSSRTHNYAFEDKLLGQCLAELGVTLGDSRDEQGKTQFHCFYPNLQVQGGWPKWFTKYDQYHTKPGLEDISDHPITFHWLQPMDLTMMEFYVYHLLLMKQTANNDTARGISSHLTENAQTPNDSN